MTKESARLGVRRLNTILRDRCGGRLVSRRIIKHQHDMYQLGNEYQEVACVDGIKMRHSRWIILKLFSVICYKNVSFRNGEQVARFFGFANFLRFVLRFDCGKPGAGERNFGNIHERLAGRGGFPPDPIPRLTLLSFASAPMRSISTCRRAGAAITRNNDSKTCRNTNQSCADRAR